MILKRRSVRLSCRVRPKRMKGMRQSLKCPEDGENRTCSLAFALVAVVGMPFEGNRRRFATKEGALMEVLPEDGGEVGALEEEEDGERKEGMILSQCGWSVPREEGGRRLVCENTARAHVGQTLGCFLRAWIQGQCTACPGYSAHVKIRSSQREMTPSGNSSDFFRRDVMQAIVLYNSAHNV